MWMAHWLSKVPHCCLIGPLLCLRRYQTGAEQQKARGAETPQAPRQCYCAAGMPTLKSTCHKLCWQVLPRAVGGFPSQNHWCGCTTATRHLLNQQHYCNGTTNRHLCIHTANMANFTGNTPVHWSHLGPFGLPDLFCGPACCVHCCSCCCLRTCPPTGCLQAAQPVTGPLSGRCIRTLKPLALVMMLIVLTIAAAPPAAASAHLCSRGPAH